jgi:hypothetical protein
MKHEISNAIPTEGSQVSRRTRLPRFVPVAATAAVPATPMSQRLTPSRPRIPFSRRMGWFLTAALVLSFLSAFTSASSAHASGGGGCMSYNTWSNNATSQYNTNPIMYQGRDTPALGLGLNSCPGQAYGNILIHMRPNEVCIEGCPDYFQIDWQRSGSDSWQVFGSSLNADDAILSPVQLGTSYEVAVKECSFSGNTCRCSDWSPTVGITT